jgi:hypothetical protein
MPLTLSVGLTRKVGLPGYSSLGAHCHVEVELSASLLQEDLDGFFRQVRQAYGACARAVDEQLSQWRANGSVTNHHPSLPQEPADDDGHAMDDEPPHGNSSHGAPAYERPNGEDGGHESSRVSSKQLDFARQLAMQIRGLGARRLETLAGHLLGKPLADLSRAEASVLIETLKNLRAGTADLASLLEGDAS